MPANSTEYERFRTIFACGCIMEGHDGFAQCPNHGLENTVIQHIATDNIQYLKPIYYKHPDSDQSAELYQRIEGILGLVGDEVAPFLFNAHDPSDLREQPPEHVFMVHDALHRVAEREGEGLATWLIEPHVLLDGRSPAEAMNLGDYDRVWRAARS